MRYLAAFIFALFVFVPALALASLPPCRPQVVDAGTYPDGGTWTQTKCVYPREEPGCGGLLGGLPVAAGVVLLPMVGRRRRS